MPSTQNSLSGVLHFLTPQTRSSLSRNDRVRMTRDDRGNFVDSEGVETEPLELAIKDARQLPAADAMMLESNGFELKQAPVANYDFMDHQSVITDYYRDCQQLVAEATGARVWAFDHNIRSAGGLAEKRQVKGGQDVQGPAHIVHGDYTLRSAPERLAQLTRPPSVNDTLREMIPEGQGLVPEEAAHQALADGGRFAIINVWRNIKPEPVATHPLALCDGRDVQPEDLVVFEIHMPDRVGENYWAKYDARHTFYSYPGMTRDEALLIKQWDSGGLLARSDGAQADHEAQGPCTFSFHSAFNDPDTPTDAPDRWSIEVRCLAVY
ncbi:MAG: hypothetical protein ACI96M_004193 [Candidatus Azotimanducaceae bacterium]|jgi:hypothetical protein